MPEDQTEYRRDVLAFASFRIASPRVPPNPADNQEETRMWNNLAPFSLDQPIPSRRGFVIRSLERRIVERLVPRIGIPLEVKIYPRPGSIELGVLILGSYALLRDYKPLRESLKLLEQDIKEVLSVPPDWTVEVADIQTPGDSDARRVGGPVGLATAPRYSWVAFLIINVVALVINIAALIFFGYLVFTVVMANT
jgi:hypothetical protein